MTAVIVQQPKVTAQIVVEETTTQVVVTPKTTLELTLAGTQGPAGIQGPIGPVGPPGPSSNPEGTDGQVQYNNGGSFGGASSLYYDDVNNRVGIGTSSPTSKLEVKEDTSGSPLVTFVNSAGRGMTIKPNSDGNGAGGATFGVVGPAANFQFQGDLVPQPHFTYNLGNPSLSWLTVYTSAVKGRDNSAQGILELRSGHTNQPLTLGIDTTEYMRVHTTGDIGIGSIAPTAKLTVANGTSPTNFHLYNTYTDGSNYERANLAWNSNTFEISTEALGTGTGRTLRLTSGADSLYFKAAGGSTQLRFDGQKLFPTVDSGLNLGTTALHFGNIHLKGDIDFGVFSSRIYWGDPNISIGLPAGNIRFTSYSNSVMEFYDVSTGNFVYAKPAIKAFSAEIFEGSTSGTNTYVRGWNGYAGSSGGDLVVQGGDSGVGPQYAGGNAGDLFLQPGIQTDNTQGNEGVRGQLLFSTYTSGNTPTLTERMRINADGKVGIGTSSPVVRLDVNGQISSSTGYVYGSPQFIDSSIATNTGIGVTASTIVTVYTQGDNIVSFGRYSAGGLRLRGDLTEGVSLGWVNGHATSNNADLRLWRDGTGILAQRNGTDPQAYRIYNTYTDASNYERAAFKWVSNNFVISPEASGTGTPGELYLYGGANLNRYIRITALDIKLRNSSGELTVDGGGIWPSAYSGQTIGRSTVPFESGYFSSKVNVNSGSVVPYTSGGITPLLELGFNNYGIHTDNNGDIVVIGNTIPRASLGLAGTRLSSTGAIQWSNNLSAYQANTYDVQLHREAAGVLAQQAGTTAQTYKLYNTYTDASNYELGWVGWDGNTFRIGPIASGTGTIRPVIVRLGSQIHTFTTAGNVEFAKYIQVADGSGIAPSITGNTSTTSGWAFIGAEINYVRASSPMFRFSFEETRHTLNGKYNWSGTASANGTPDTGLARYSAGVVKITDGSTGTGDLIAGTLTIGNLIAQDIETTGQDVHLNADDTGSAFIHSGSQGAGAGLYLAGAGDLSTAAAAIDYNGISIRQPNYLGWTSGSAINSSNDLYLYRDAANTLAQRNSTNAQVFNIYNTYTDASNYERGFLKWDSNFLKIGTEAAGTGSNRSLWLTPASGQVFVPTGVGAAIISAYANGTRILADTGLYLNGYNGGLYLQTSNGPITRTRIEATPGFLSTSSTDDYGIQLAQTLNATVANPGAEYRALKINVTETDTTGWDNVYLFDAQVGGVTKTHITNSGDLRAFGIFGLSASGVASYYVRTGAIQHYQGHFAGATNGALGPVNGAEWVIRSNGAYAWSSTTTAYSAVDLKLWRDAPYTLAQRFGTNPQTFNIYNTYTDASNYERGFLKWESNYLKIGTESAGTGSDRSVSLYFGSSEKLRVGIGQVFTVDLVPFSTAGNYDLGGTSFKWHDLYLSGGIEAAGSFGTAGQVLTSNGTTVSWQDSAGEFTALTDTPANYTGHAGKLVRVNSAATELEFTDQIDLDEIVFDATTAPANGTIVADTFPMYLTATGTSPNRELALKVKTQDDQEIIIASVLV